MVAFTDAATAYLALVAAHLHARRPTPRTESGLKLINWNTHLRDTSHWLRRARNKGHLHEVTADDFVGADRIAWRAIHVVAVRQATQVALATDNPARRWVGATPDVAAGWAARVLAANGALADDVLRADAHADAQMG